MYEKTRRKVWQVHADGAQGAFEVAHTWHGARGLKKAGATNDGDKAWDGQRQASRKSQRCSLRSGAWRGGGRDNKGAAGVCKGSTRASLLSLQGL